MARPAGPTEPNDLKMTSVRISTSLWDRVKRKAHNTGSYGSEALHEALTDWDNRHPEPSSSTSPPRRGRKPPVTS